MALLLVPRRKLRIELKGNAVQLCALGLEDDNKYILMLASMLKGFIDTDLLDLDAASQYLPILPKLLSEFDSALFYFHSEDLKYLQPSIVQQVAAKSDPQVILSFSPEHSLPSQDERLKSYGMADTDLSGKTISPPSSNLNSPVKKHQRPSQPLGIPKRRSLPASSAVLSQLDRTSIPPGMGAFSHNDGPKGFRKPSKIKMMELNESADLKKSVDDAKRKLESDTKAEKERKAREKEMEIQARKGARVAAAEEKRLSKIRIEEDRIQKQNERELKRKQREDDVEEQKRKSLFTLPPAQPVIPEAAVASSSNIEHVLDGAIGVSEIDVQLIDEFLHGKYGMFLDDCSKARGREDD